MWMENSPVAKASMRSADFPLRPCRILHAADALVEATLKERLLNIFCGEEFLEKKSV
jgi:hypothetical protein